jgi:AAA domain
MNLDEALRQAGIHLKDTSPGQHMTTCPNCSHKRKKSRDPCLGVKIDEIGVLAHCNHCGWKTFISRANSKANGRAHSSGASKKRPTRFIPGDVLPLQPNEVRRHTYCRDGVPVLVKIRQSTGAKFLPWYKVDGGWQNEKPEGYKDTPYFKQGFDPLYKEGGGFLFWPEGEKDTETIADLGFRAFTFGAAKYVPDEAAQCVKGEDVVVVGDNDADGVEGAQKRADFAHRRGAKSVRVIYPHRELNDITDYVQARRKQEWTPDAITEEIEDLVAVAPPWQPSEDPKPKGLSFVLYESLDATVTKIWVVYRLLGAGECSGFYGPPGSGKSVLVEDLGLHVAAGREWCGRKVIKGMVLYIALERRELVKRRAIAFRNKTELKSLPFAVTGGLVNFRDDKAASLIGETIQQVEIATKEKVVLIIIDTVFHALCGGDENSSKDMGAFIATLGRIHELYPAAHILLVHHVPQDADRLRGHGSLFGVLDVTVAVAKDANRRTATVRKASDGNIEGEQIVFTLESVDVGRDDNGDVTTAPVLVPITGGQRADQPKQAKLPKAAQIALRALKEAIDEVGTVPPASNHIPPKVKTVTIEQWRDYAYRRGISTGEDRAKQQAFKRASEQLISGQHAAVWNGLVWLGA